MIDVIQNVTDSCPVNPNDLDTKRWAPLDGEYIYIWFLSKIDKWYNLWFMEISSMHW